ncbi:phosphatidylserine decarboxylase [Inediibacterium massiliense]|uniref:phosphatidylserine decarboxylase n=1 Tax=Inediibacterium massiliense TaxID=1658111 RepID=UPI0006B64ACF|nr:phosphatidylserine decarboxylase [Inediibacterium massiliense]
MEIYYINRKTATKEKEIVAGDSFLRWIYDTKTGSTILEMIVKRKMFSSIYGKMQDLSSSKRKIHKFAEDLKIDMKEAEIENIEDYKNFNDFFARRLKKEARPIEKEESHLVSPADGRILAYENIDKNSIIQVKGFTYTLEELIGDEKLSKEYDGGACIVIRLCPADYHRFHFPDSGIPMETKKIKGMYYSVNPIALKKVASIYCQNKREITLFQSDHFKEVIMIEVGATCVGSIIQTYIPNKRIQKGEEKGYFKFGGSTVILFLKKGAAHIDQDLLKNTENEIETKVNMGERIGINKA